MMELLGLVEVPGWLLCLLAVTLSVYYYYVNYYDNVFRRQGVPSRPGWPLPVVVLYMTFFMKGNNGIPDLQKAAVEKYGKVFAQHENGKVALVVSDEEMLKDILVKEFDYFRNRFNPFSSTAGLDPMVDNMLTVLRDAQWKRVRALLTPNFSTGKIRMMSHHLNVCAVQLIDNLQAHTANKKEFEMKDMCSSFSMDVIARAVFGIEINTQMDPKSPFVEHAKRIIAMPLWRIMLLFLLMAIPGGKYFTKYFPIFDKGSTTFFRNIVNSAIDMRTTGDSKSQGRDFIQICLAAQKDMEITGRKGMNRDEILANGFIFFLAGYDTVATVLSLLLYNLALHPEQQEQVYQEIVEVLGDDAEIDYDSIHHMTYLDQCVQESMRLYPAAFRVDREVMVDCTIRGIKIPAGSLIVVPIHSIHTDPDVWPDPDTFDPERFCPDARATHSSFQHMPFGYGPRNCIAMRLALVEVMMAAAHMIKNFRFETYERTQIPLKFQWMGFEKTQQGVYLKVVHRADEAPQAHSTMTVEDIHTNGV